MEEVVSVNSAHEEGMTRSIEKTSQTEHRENAATKGNEERDAFPTASVTENLEYEPEVTRRELWSYYCESVTHRPSTRKSSKFV